MEFSDEVNSLIRKYAADIVSAMREGIASDATVSTIPAAEPTARRKVGHRISDQERESLRADIRNGMRPCDVMAKYSISASAYYYNVYRMRV